MLSCALPCCALQADAERAGLDWSKFRKTDNTCAPHPSKYVAVPHSSCEFSLLLFLFLVPIFDRGRYGIYFT